MSRTLITGASGFTGRYLVDRLSRDGHELFGIERRVADGERHDLALYEADLLDVEGLTRVIAEVRPQKVVHLAAVAFVAHSDVSSMYAVNVVGTRNLLHALSTAGLEVDTVVIASSANVYGNQRSGELNEQMPPCPANDYGVSKLASEHLARIFGDRLPIVVTRPFNYTGVGQSEQFLIPKIVGHAKRGERIIELGNLDVARDFSDVRFVANCYAGLLGTPEAIGGTFNICSGIPRSLNSVLATVAEISGVALEPIVNPSLVRRDEVRTLSGSRAKLDAMIGCPQAPALDDTIRWMLEAPSCA